MTVKILSTLEDRDNWFGPGPSTSVFEEPASCPDNDSDPYC